MPSETRVRLPQYPPVLGQAQFQQRNLHKGPHGSNMSVAENPPPIRFTRTGLPARLCLAGPCRIHGQDGGVGVSVLPEVASLFTERKMLSSALYASFFFTVALLVTTAYFLMGGLPLLTLKHDTPLDARFVRGFFNVYYRAAFWASLGAFVQLCALGQVSLCPRRGGQCLRRLAAAQAFVAGHAAARRKDRGQQRRGDSALSSCAYGSALRQPGSAGSHCLGAAVAVPAAQIKISVASQATPALCVQPSFYLASPAPCGAIGVKSSGRHTSSLCANRIQRPVRLMMT